MRRPARVPLTVRRCATLRQPINWKAAPRDGGSEPEPVDLTGFHARAQFRVNGRLALTLDSDPAAQRDGTITIDPEAGSLLLLADVAATTGIPAGSGAWSVVLNASGGDTIPLLEGRLTVLEAVTT